MYLPRGLRPHGVVPSVRRPFSLNNAPYYTVYVVFFVHGLASCLRRGPHHPHGQRPVEQKHHHYQPRSAQSLTSDSKLLHDTKHLEEDSHVLTEEALAKMSPEELEFHYFSAHDYDRNSKLDGLEMLKAVYHTVEHAPEDPEDDSIELDGNRMDLYISLVDKTLSSDDTDGDGYISYSEYRAARANTSNDKGTIVVAERLP